MNDHDALLRTICENPRDDTPRLVFADWLEENGQPELAAFIRTDIAMSLRDEWDCERLKWEEQASEKGHQAWGDFWWARLEHQRCVQVIGLRRGFPWRFRVLDFCSFRTVAAELFAATPVEHLEFRGSLPNPERLIAEPWFPRIAGLGWQTGRHNAEAIHPLLVAPSNLAELTLREFAFHPEGFQALLQSPLYRQLTRVELARVHLRVARAALDTVGQRREPSRLRAFSLREVTLNRAAPLLASRLPLGLRVLDITKTRINSEAGRAFAEVDNLSGLRVLIVNSNPLGNVGGTALFTSPHLAGLKVLDLSYCQVGDEALRALLDNSPLADGLNLLTLNGSPASAEMKQAVKDRMGDRVRL